MLRGFGTVMDDLKAKAQALIGQMLMARAKLNDIRAKTDDPNISAQRNTLEASQTDLETELGTVNTQLNSGESLSVADYASIGVFLVKVKTQVDSVDQLSNDSKGVATSPLTFGNMAAAGGILAVLGLGYYLWKRK
jgi:hypothetical protein